MFDCYYYSFLFSSGSGNDDKAGPGRRIPRIATKTAPPSKTPLSPVPSDQSIGEMLSELDTPDVQKSSSSSKDSSANTSRSKRSLKYSETDQGKKSNQGTLLFLCSLSKFPIIYMVNLTVKICCYFVYKYYLSILKPTYIVITIVILTSSLTLQLI